MNRIYSSSEVGWLVIIFLLPFMILLGVIYTLQWGNNPLPLYLFILLELLFISLLLLFYKLTTEVYADQIVLKYGIGLIRITFRTDSINSITSLKTPWYWGLGIRITPQGMLYNIHSLQALKIDYQIDGRSKSVLLGTPDPASLEKSLKEMTPITSDDQAS